MLFRPCLKQTALRTFDTEAGPGDLAAFVPIVDLRFVLKLVEIAETGNIDDGAKALHRMTT